MASRRGQPSLRSVRALCCAARGLGLGSHHRRNFRAVALDLDGTTLDEAGRLTDTTVATLRRVHESGMHVILATGRPTNSLQPIVDKLRLRGEVTACVNFNGAVAQMIPCTPATPAADGTRPPARRLLFSTTLPLASASAVLDVCDAMGACVSYTCLDGAHAAPQNPAHSRALTRFEEMEGVQQARVEDLRTLLTEELPLKIIAMSDDPEASAARARELLSAVVGLQPGSVHVIPAEMHVPPPRHKYPDRNSELTEIYVVYVFENRPA
jgi:hydroxymethylpyrimidine pyrophosphatase-like HAD family hydrolase